MQSQFEKDKPHRSGGLSKDTNPKDELSTAIQNIGNLKAFNPGFDRKKRVLQKIMSIGDRLVEQQDLSFDQDCAKSLAEYFVNGIDSTNVTKDDEEDILYANAILFLGQMMLEAPFRNNVLDLATFDIAKIRLCLWPFCEKKKVAND